MVIFVSDSLSQTGYISKEGVLRPGIEAVSWRKFAGTHFDTRIIVFDLNLERHVREDGYSQTRLIKSDRRDYFRNLFQKFTTEQLLI